MTKQELIELSDYYRKKADKEYGNYQDTGMRRYQRSYEKASDLADALEMAASAAEEHADYLHLRYQLSEFAARAQDIRLETSCEKQLMTERLLKDLEAYGVLRGLLRRNAEWTGSKL